MAESGGILTQPLSLSYHHFSHMYENRIKIGDFYHCASPKLEAHFKSTRCKEAV
jgi:hypothetical protein